MASAGEEGNFSLEDLFNFTNANLNHSSHQCVFSQEFCQNVLFWVGGVGTCTVALLGAIGNLLSITVLSQRKVRSTISLILLVLSLCDLVVCVLLMVSVGVPNVLVGGLQYHYVAQQINRWVCENKKFMFIALLPAQMTSTYLIVAITIERYFLVVQPLRSKTWITYQKVKYAVATILIFSLIASLPRNIPHLFHQDSVDENGKCHALPPALPKFARVLRLTCYLLFDYTIPLIVVLMGNVGIMNKIRKQNNRRESLSETQIKQIKLTKMIVVVVAVYYFCNIFRVVNTIMNNFFQYVSAEMVATTNFLVSLNSSVNYLIYCAFGKTFRQSFLNMFCSCKFTKTPKNRISLRKEDESLPMEVSMLASIRRFSKVIVDSIKH